MEKQQSRSARWINRALLVVMVLIFAAGLGKTVFCPDEIDYYENRYANKVAHLSAASYLGCILSGQHGGCPGRSSAAGHHGQANL